MKRFSTLLGRKGSPTHDTTQAYSSSISSNASGDSPDGSAPRAVRLFCESGSTNNRDEEVLHLPTIVDGAESSPAAAAACAQQIRIFMSKQFMAKPHVQYNAIMLIRILSDNPGASFTQSFDDKFVKTTKTLLREGQDQSVQQLLRETLDSLEANRREDAGIHRMIQMWTKEKSQAARFYQPERRSRPQAVQSTLPLPQNNGSDHSRGPSRHRLPSAQELASRVEEARNTAKILMQFLQTTPSEEISSNELIREFADRCQTAQQSMQTYIRCDSPPPDDDTLQTLIETNEQLSLAMSRYQRAILAARRATGTSPQPPLGARSTSQSHLQADQPLRDDRVLTPTPPPPQHNGYSAFQNSASFDDGQSYRQSYAPSISPPSTHAQPHLSISSQTPSRRGDDFDDLYDSPRITQASKSDNPFSDPADRSAQARSSQHAPALPQESGYRNVSPPDSPPTFFRPAPAAWHNSTITSSFLGRQASAADGLTMHAPVMINTPSEIDGHSNVGRTEYMHDIPHAPTSFTVTYPPPTRTSPRLSRVDVAGTGGFRPA